MTTSGLGIAGLLKHTSDSGGGGQWLRTWRKKGVGEVTIWLHTRAPIVPCFSHSFMFEDEYEDKETQKTVPTLRYPRFVSPDAEIVHRNQYFRNDDGTMQVPPDLDPFLLLREWLRFGAEHIGLEDPIFKWHNAKERKDIVWERGTLSGQVKRGKNNFNHSLDTKLEYIYVVVDNDDVDAGPVLAREGKLVSQKIVEVIKHQQKQYGDVEGDPTQHPYAFQIIAEDASSPMNAYKAFKAERAAFSDEVWAQVSSEDFPDPLQYGQPSEGDMEKIRELFEQAAQVELPLDQIFSEDPAVRRDVTRPTGGGKRPPPRASKAAQSAGTGAQPKPAAVQPPVPQRSATSKPDTSKPDATPAAAAGGGSPQMRLSAAPSTSRSPMPEQYLLQLKRNLPTPSQAAQSRALRSRRVRSQQHPVRSSHHCRTSQVLPLLRRKPQTTAGRAEWRSRGIWSARRAASSREMTSHFDHAENPPKTRER
jgi:hypothetical protein